MLVLDRLNDIIRRQRDEELKRGPQAALEAARHDRDHRRFATRESERRRALKYACAAAAAAIASAASATIDGSGTVTHNAVGVVTGLP